MGPPKPSFFHGFGGSWYICLYLFITAQSLEVFLATATMTSPERYHVLLPSLETNRVKENQWLENDFSFVVNVAYFYRRAFGVSSSASLHSWVVNLRPPPFSVPLPRKPGLLKGLLTNWFPFWPDSTLILGGGVCVLGGVGRLTSHDETDF